MNTYTIYMHRNQYNGKVYIGQTCQKPEKRWNNGKGYESSPRFYNAILKYGWSSFDHIILYTELTLEQANQKEQQLIQEYHSNDERYGYNITSGGHNFSHTEETKKKIGAANSIALKGNKWSESQRELISNMFSGEGNPFYGKRHTEETKQLISKHRKGKRAGEEHPMYGKHHTKDNLQKMSDNRKSKGGQKVICLNNEKIFNTMMDAARWCGLSNASSIGQVCNHTGKQKTAGRHPETGEKLTWSFIE